MMQSTSYSTPLAMTPVARDALDAAVVARVDQRDVRPIERRQIVVVERRPFAELPIPRLQFFRDVGILHGVVDARADAVHFLEVGDLGQHRRFALRRGRFALPATCG